MRARVLFVAILAVASAAPARATDPEPYRVCGHASLTATPIPRHGARHGGFYFDAINAEQNGVDGHPVELIVFDDGYSPAGARHAAETCVQAGAQLLVGLSGIDQHLGAARWSEQNLVPYLHGTMPASTLEEDDLTWSAAIGPTTEDLMHGLARVMIEDSGAAPVFGLVRVDSPFYVPGRDAFADALADAGYPLTVDIPVQKDERQFATAWFELRSHRVTHVVLDLPPNLVLGMLRQKPPGYDPSFGSAHPTVGAEIIAGALPDVPFIVFHDPGPVYHPDDASLPWFAEMQEFLRIFETYSPEQAPPPNDFDWNSYLRAKQIHRFLDALDEDLSPEHIRSMFSTHAEEEADAFPTCALDFESEPRFGADAWHAFRLEDGDWMQAATCVTAEGVDLAPPRIDCPDVVVGALVCTIDDRGSGIGAYRMVDEATPGSSVVVEADIGCAETVEIEHGLTLGLHRLRVEATDCGDRSSSHTSLGFGSA